MNATERALILAKREGYANALIIRDKDEGAAMAEAGRVYPFIETRPRIVRESAGGRAIIQWRFIDGKFETLHLSGCWTDHWLTVDFLRTLLDLAERPTETVPVDETEEVGAPAEQNAESVDGPTDFTADDILGRKHYAAAIPRCAP